MLQKYNISGFPTIVLLDSKNDLIKTLNGERTLESLNAFVQ
jgi:thioredoxin-related protein